jgi:hypothetical protein
MLEFLAVMFIILALGTVFLMLTSIFIAYVTQANYVDPLHDEGDETDD